MLIITAYTNPRIPPNLVAEARVSVGRLRGGLLMGGLHKLLLLPNLTGTSPNRYLT